MSRAIGWCGLIACFSVAAAADAQTRSNEPAPQRLSPPIATRLGGPGGVPLGGPGSLRIQPVPRPTTTPAPVPRTSSFQDLAAGFDRSAADDDAPD